MCLGNATRCGHGALGRLSPSIWTCPSPVVCSSDCWLGGHNAVTGSGRRCSRSDSRCRCSRATHCRPSPTPPSRSCWCCRPVGLALLHYTWYAAAGVAFLMLVVVASYRQNVHAYPSGGGDYEVATVNLGRRAGVTVASALMVDYVLTVAVSVSSGVANITSAVQSLAGPRGRASPSAIVLVIMVLNLRGIRESGTAFAIPTYAFIAGIAVLIAVGFTKIFTGHKLLAESANLHVVPPCALQRLRPRCSCCCALSPRGAPRSPASRRSATASRRSSHRRATTRRPLSRCSVRSRSRCSSRSPRSRSTATCTLPRTRPISDLPAGSHQKTVIAQIGATVFGGDRTIGFYYLQAVTALILVLAANTAFNGFPVLASILARDGYLPRQLHTRGDRLAFSNGILLLAGFAILLIFAFSASPTRLIQLYIVGVFVSFVNSQFGMIRHWNRNLPLTTEPGSATADVPIAGHQHRRRDRDVARARHHPDLEVRRGCMDRDRRDGRAVRDDARHQEALRPGEGGALRRRRRRANVACARARDRVAVEVAQADDARTGLRASDSAVGARSGHGQRRQRRNRGARGGMGAPCVAGAVEGS